MGQVYGPFQLGRPRAAAVTAPQEVHREREAVSAVGCSASLCGCHGSLVLATTRPIASMAEDPEQRSERRAV